MVMDSLFWQGAIKLKTRKVVSIFLEIFESSLKSKVFNFERSTIKYGPLNGQMIAYILKDMIRDTYLISVVQ